MTIDFCLPWEKNKKYSKSIYPLENQEGHLLVKMEKRGVNKWSEEQLNELCLFMGGIFSTKLSLKVKPRPVPEQTTDAQDVFRTDNLIVDKSLGPGNDHPQSDEPQLCNGTAPCREVPLSRRFLPHWIWLP